MNPSLLAIGLVVLALSVTVKTAVGQASTFPLRKTIYLELGGSGGTPLSVNAELLTANNLAPRIGLSYGELFGSALVSVPLSVSRLKPLSGGHAFEVGLGVTPGWHTVDTDAKDRSEAFVFVTATVGFRYTAPENGLFFRLSAVPAVSVVGTPEIKIGQVGIGVFPGLAAGYIF